MTTTSERLQGLLLLTISTLLLASCVHTRRVSSMDAVIDEINQKRKGDAAVVSLKAAPSTRLVAERLELASDSLAWIDKRMARHAVELEGLSHVDFVYRGRGALEGLGLGTLSGIALGLLIGLREKDDPPDVFLRLRREDKMALDAIVMGVVGAGLGTLVGAVMGSKDRFDFSTEDSNKR